MKEKFRLDVKTGEFVNVLTEDGREIPDPVPMAPPVGFTRQQPLHERIRAMVQHEFLRRKQEADVESPEEADDFVIEDENDARYGEKFAILPGHEHEWEENYEPPKDFKDMRDRLIDAGWTPPQSDVEAQQARTPPEGGATAYGSGIDPGNAGTLPAEPKTKVQLDSPPSSTVRGSTRGPKAPSPGGRGGT